MSLRDMCYKHHHGLYDKKVFIHNYVEARATRKTSDIIRFAIDRIQDGVSNGIMLRFTASGNETSSMNSFKEIVGFASEFLGFDLMEKFSLSYKSGLLKATNIETRQNLYFGSATNENWFMGLAVENPKHAFTFAIIDEGQSRTGKNRVDDDTFETLISMMRKTLFGRKNDVRPDITRKLIFSSNAWEATGYVMKKYTYPYLQYTKEVMFKLMNGNGKSGTFREKVYDLKSIEQFYKEQQGEGIYVFDDADAMDGLGIEVVVASFLACEKLTKPDFQQILLDLKGDKELAKAQVFGIPANFKGNVYNAEIKLIPADTLQDKKYIGIRNGTDHSSTIDVTTGMTQLITEQLELILFSMFYYHNKENYLIIQKTFYERIKKHIEKDVIKKMELAPDFEYIRLDLIKYLDDSETAFLLNDFYIFNKVQINQQYEKWIVRVDANAKTYIAMLRLIQKANRDFYNIEYHSSLYKVKFPVKKRIEVLNGLMALGKVSTASETIFILFNNELRGKMWVSKEANGVAIPKRSDRKDDLINTFEYMNSDLLPYILQWLNNEISSRGLKIEIMK